MFAFRVGLVTGFAGVIVAVIYFAMIDNAPLPYHPAVDGWNDTLLHTGAFALLAFFALLIWTPTLRTAVLLLLFGVVIELAQLVVPARQADLLDVCANIVGIVSGYAAFYSARWLMEGKIVTLVGMRK